MMCSKRRLGRGTRLVFTWTLLGGLWGGCGGLAPAEVPGLPLDLALSQSFPLADLRAFQLVLLDQGSKRDCSALQQSCLSAQVPPQQWLDLNGRRSVEVDAELTQGTQEVELPGLPIGQDFALVIEAISHADTFLGSSCNYVREIRDGRNEPLLAQPIEGTPLPCHPLP